MAAPMGVFIRKAPARSLPGGHRTEREPGSAGNKWPRLSSRLVAMPAGGDYFLPELIDYEGLEETRTTALTLPSSPAARVRLLLRHSDVSESDVRRALAPPDHIGSKMCSWATVVA